MLFHISKNENKIFSVRRWFDYMLTMKLTSFRNLLHKTALFQRVKKSHSQNICAYCLFLSSNEKYENKNSHKTNIKLHQANISVTYNESRYAEY